MVSSRVEWFYKTDLLFREILWIANYVKGTTTSFIFNCTEPYFINEKLEKVHITTGHYINDVIKEMKKQEMKKNPYDPYYKCNSDHLSKYNTYEDGVWFDKSGLKILYYLFFPLNYIVYL